MACLHSGQFFGMRKRVADWRLLGDFQHVGITSPARSMRTLSPIANRGGRFRPCVQGGTADSDASDLHWLEHGDWRERAGAADLHANVVDHGGFLAGGIFVAMAQRGALAV